jgi:uncharacterized protein YsxB (DUF464 family)
MKLLPYSVTVLPAYAAVGHADATEGDALICSTFDALVAAFPTGLEKFTLTLQLAALIDAAVTTKILVLLTMEQLIATTPQMAAEQICEPWMKLLPDTVTRLPA